MIDTYAPIFIVEIDGKELPEDISSHIERFSYDDDEEKMDELKITLADGNMEFIDNPQLQEGKEIKARWGYLGNMSELRTCTIKEISYTFGEDRVARMEITALDKGHKLTGRAARTCWNNKKIADIVKDIASKHNLTPKIEIPEDITQEFISQGGKSDWIFLKELANETGCLFWVTNDELHFKPDSENEPVRKFSWGQDGDGYLQSMRITTNAEKGKGTTRGTETAGLNPFTKKKIKETVKVEASGSDTTLQALGDKPVPENNSGGSSLAENKVQNETPPKQKNDETGRIAASPAPTAAHARRSSKGKVKKKSRKSIEVTATTIGLPYLKAKETITIENIGKKFSGNWRIKKVVHSISRSGYTCSLTLCRSNSGGGKKAGDAPKVTKNNSTAKPASQAGTKNNNNSNKKPPKQSIDLNKPGALR